MISYPVPAAVLFEQYVGPADSLLDVLPVLTPDYRLTHQLTDNQTSCDGSTLLAVMSEFVWR